MAVAFGRWGVYVRSPVPGLYLADFLLGIAGLTGLFAVGRVSRKLAIVLVSAIPVGYIGVRLITITVRSEAFSTTLMIRDLAPYLYIATIPLIAASLTHGPRLGVVWVLRIAPFVYALGFWGEAYGLLQPVASPLLGSPYVAFLSFRSDLLGMIAALGIIAWSSWANARNYPIPQALLFGLGVMSPSQTAQLCVIAAGLFVLTRHLNRVMWRRIGVVAVLLLGISIGLGTQYFQPRDAAAPSTSKLTPEAAPSTEPANQDPWQPSGTVGARLLTWQMIVENLSSRGALLVGFGPGSDGLSQICAESQGFPWPPEFAWTKRMKCPVDSNESPTALRDPHNWLLNLLVYGGALGLLCFLVPLAIWVYAYRSAPFFAWGLVSMTVVFIAGSFNVILSSPVGLIPLTVLAAQMARQDGCIGTGASRVHRRSI